MTFTLNISSSIEIILLSTPVFPACLAAYNSLSLTGSIFISVYGYII